MDFMRFVVPTTVFSAFVTLLSLAPVGYVLYRNLPPRVVTVDLQKLVEDEHKRMLELIGKGRAITEEQRVVAEKLTIHFAQKLSATIGALGQECRCVIINKAAILGGGAIDYTEQIRERMKK